MLLVLVMAVPLVTAVYLTLHLKQEKLPNFAAYTQVKEKKNAFFDYLTPHIQAANHKIAKDRTQLLVLADQLEKQGAFSFVERAKLVNICTQHNLQASQADSDQALMTRALLHIDEVPASLTLIQAAKESGWGTSKFAQLGNNLFGQQCFSKGCGMMPAHRAPGRNHEVAVFQTPGHAVSAYMRNLNSHHRYAPLRKIRAKLRANQQHITGFALADGLIAYSERGSAYVKEIKSMIRQNALE